MGFFDFFAKRKSTDGRFVKGVRSAWYVRESTLVNEDTAMKVAAFNRGVTYISTQIAKLPWEVKDSEFEIADSPIGTLLALSPNPETNAFFWRIFMVSAAIIHGNSYSEIERDNSGRPIALWPLDTRLMHVCRTETGELVYKYSDPQNGVIYFYPRDIFHLRNFHTKDGIVGQGLVAYGAETLGIQIAADDLAAGLFQNSGIPSGVLTHPGKLKIEAQDEVLATWKRTQGGKKSGSTALLVEGVTYTPTKIDTTTLQFIESRQFGVLEIARFLGIPPTKLFDTTASTFSNVEQSNLEVATDTLDTWATNLEIEADVKLLNNRYGGRFTDIDLYSIFRGDMKSRSDYFKTMLSIGTMTPNQIRAREGMKGYGEAGDNYYIATNNFTPVDRMEEILDADIEFKRAKSKQALTPPAASPAPDDSEEPSNKPDPVEAMVLRLLGDLSGKS